MRGAIPPLPSTPLRRVAQLNHRDNFTFNSHSSANQHIFLYYPPSCISKRKWHIGNALALYLEGTWFQLRSSFTVFGRLFGFLYTLLATAQLHVPSITAFVIQLP